MRIDEWCKVSQNDQIVEKCSIVYANFGHSVKRSLLGTDGIDKFQNTIASLPVPDLSLIAPEKQKEARDFGLASIAIDMASDAQYPLSSGADPIANDFRLSGNQINRDEIFLNVYYRAVMSPAKSATAGGAPSVSSSAISSSAKPSRISWLTRIEHLEDKLKDALSKAVRPQLSVNEFFSEIVALLGLRPSEQALINGHDSECRLQVVRMRSPGRLRRPHVFSRGYPERWCGVSPLQPFGATVDNRTGKAGLPEAIAFFSDTDLQDPGTSDYETVRDRLKLLVDLSSIGSGSYIETRMLTSHYHTDDDQARFRTEALRRLEPVGCTTACNGLGSANCLCT